MQIPGIIAFLCDSFLNLFDLRGAFAHSVVVKATRVLAAADAIGLGRDYSCHAVEEAQYWEYEPHYHVDCCDLTYLYRGSLDQTVNGRHTHLGEGMTTLVRDGDLHSLRSRGLVMYTVNFRPDLLARAAAFLGVKRQVDALVGASSAPVFRTDRARQADLLREFQGLLYNQHTPGASLLFHGFLVRWLVDAIGSAEAADSSPVPQWLTDLLQYIDENVEFPVAVSDLSRIAGKSGEHIARCFRTFLHTTPSQAVNAARVNRAALLLAHTNRDVLDICYAVGYNSASYFYRLFRERYGMPPHQYRRTNSVLHARYP